MTPKDRATKMIESGETNPAIVGLMVYVAELAELSASKAASEQGGA